MSQNKKRKAAREKKQRRSSRERLYKRVLISKIKNPSTFTRFKGVLREYNQPHFLHISNDVKRLGMCDNLHSQIYRDYWSSIAAGTYSGEKARTLVQDSIVRLEARLCEIISKGSIAYWLHLIRRITPGFAHTDPRGLVHSMAIYEAAIQKWGTFDLCGHIASSAQVSQGEILQGRLLNTGDFNMLDLLEKHPEFVLTNFGPEEMADAFRVEKLAVECSLAMGFLRGLGKGASLKVTDDTENPVSVESSNELKYLLQIQDKRNLDAELNVTATGTVFKTETLRIQNGTIVLPGRNAVGLTFEQLGLTDRFRKANVEILTYNETGPRFNWGGFNILSFYEAHRSFSGPFYDKNGVSLESVVAVIAGVSFYAVSAWEHLGFFWGALQHAFRGPVKLDDFVNQLCVAMPKILDTFKLPFNESEISVRLAVDWLTLKEQNRNEIGVCYPGPHYIFLPCDKDRVFIDYAHIWMRLYHLFHGVLLSDQNFKGVALEAFTRQRESVLTHRQLWGEDNSSRQIDAAFAIADLLIILECRVVARSIAIERGDLVALEKRALLVDKTLRDIDEKANWLATHPLGKNYDVSAFKSILPIGVTPFTEFISSIKECYWISKGIPRVLTPSELNEYFSGEKLLVVAEDCPNVISIGKSQ